MELHLESWADGILTTAEWEREGLSRSALSRASRRGEFRAIRRGVYMPVELLPFPNPLQQWAMGAIAAWKITRVPTVISHESAALLWGCVLRRNPRAHHLSVTHGSGGMRNNVWVHQQADLDPDVIRELHGVRLTSPARTAADCAVSLPRWEALHIAESLCSLGLCTPQEVLAECNSGGMKRQELATSVGLNIDLWRRETEYDLIRGRIQDLGFAAPYQDILLYTEGYAATRNDREYGAERNKNINNDAEGRRRMFGDAEESSDKLEQSMESRRNHPSSREKYFEYSNESTGNKLSDGVLRNNKISSQESKNITPLTGADMTCGEWTSVAVGWDEPRIAFLLDHGKSFVRNSAFFQTRSIWDLQSQREQEMERYITYLRGWGAGALRVSMTELFLRPDILSKKLKKCGIPKSTPQNP